MSPEEYARIQDHFLLLRDLSPVQRETQLAALASSAERAAAELGIAPLQDASKSLQILKRLLDANAAEDSLFEEPLAHLQGTSDLDPRPEGTQTLALGECDTPHSIGPYRILQKIGEGGHGLVFMAEQRTPIQRKVAVKWIKPGMESKAILARFEAERQALALMRHPSISNVIDAGTSESGRPYFVMELVHGVPIDRFCEENRLELKELLRLFQQVCDAVHHAHRKGIIHRDIKPANVLVTVDSGKPLAKVIDFGIAKAMHLSLTDKTMFTEYGQIVGTLEYMSPEQALMSQDVADVRSDVYSLGALLYVLLTGSPPISRDKLLERGIFELPKMISSARPPTPSIRTTSNNAAVSWREQSEVEKRSWSNHLRGDLDWITMKALAKELDQRYDSVAALSADIESFLCNRKVQARPPTLTYSVSKWVMRHQLTAIVLICILCTTLVSFAAVTWGYYQSQENLGEVRAANELIEQKAVELAASLDETRKARRQADQSARQMAAMMKRGLLEAGWERAFSGDSQASRRQLERIAIEDRDYAWQIVESIRLQANGPSLRTEMEGSIRKLAAHDASSVVAVITNESVLELWNLQSRKRRRTFDLPAAIYSCLSFSSSGNRLLIGAADWVQEFDLDSGTLGQRFVHGRGGTRDATFDSQRNVWHVTTGANFLLELETNTLHLKHALRLPERVSKARVSPDGQCVAIGSLTGAVFLVDLTDYSLASTLSQPGNTVFDLWWNANQLSCVDGQGRQTTWRVATDHESPPAIAGKAASIVPSKVDFVAGQFFDFVVQGPGATLAVQQKTQVVLLDLSATSKLEKIPIRRFGPAITGLHWLSSSELLLVHHFNGRVNLLNRQDIESRRNYAAQLEDLNDGIYLPKTNTTITAHRDGRLVTWNTQSGSPILERRLNGTEIFSIDAIESLDRLVSYGDDWSIRVADLDSFEEIWTARTSYGVRSIAISNQGEMIAGAPATTPEGFVPEGTFEVWDMKTGQSRVQCAGHTNWVLQFVFDSKDTNLYSLAVDGTIRRWNTANGLATLKIDFSSESSISVIGLLEDADRLICGHQDGSLSLRSLADGSLIRKVPMLNNSVGGLSVLADERVAVACTDNASTLTLLDTTNLEVLAEWDPRVGPIRGIRCDRTKTHLQILGKGMAKTLVLPPLPAE